MNGAVLPSLFFADGACGSCLVNPLSLTQVPPLPSAPGPRFYIVHSGSRLSVPGDYNSSPGHGPRQGSLVLPDRPASVPDDFSALAASLARTAL